MASLGLYYKKYIFSLYTKRPRLPTILLKIAAILFVPISNVRNQVIDSAIDIYGPERSKSEQKIVPFSNGVRFSKFGFPSSVFEPRLYTIQNWTFKNDQYLNVQILDPHCTSKLKDH